MVDVTFPMDIMQIQDCIPHRYPFLLIDRVIEAVPDESIVATKNVSISDPMLQGHFPGDPVVPGVLIVEGMAQACAVLGVLSQGSMTTCLLTEVSSARFKRKVVPGDMMRFEVKVKKKRAPFFWFIGECTVDGEFAAKVELSAFLK